MFKKQQALYELYKPIILYLEGNLEKCSSVQIIDDVESPALVANHSSSRRFHFDISINPHHQVIQKLNSELKSKGGKLSKQQSEIVDVMYYVATLSLRSNAQDAKNMTGSLENILKASIGIEREAPPIEVKVDVGENDPEVKQSQDDAYSDNYEEDDDFEDDDK